MFNKRSIEMKVVKTPKHTADSAQEQRPRMTPADYIVLSRLITKDVAILAGAGYTLKRVLDTASEIAIITAKTKIK